MSFTLEEIRAEAKKLLYKQEQEQEAERQRDTQKALQEALAKEERIRNERIRLLAEEEQVRELAKRLMIESEAKTVAETKEKAIKQEVERLRNRTPLEILEDKVRDLQDSIASPVKPKPVEDSLVLKLQERVNLLESFLLDIVESQLHREAGGTNGLIKVHKNRYKAKRNMSQSRKFKIDVHLQNDERKEWGQGFGHYGCQSATFTLSPDFTTNSIRIFQNTNQWPHTTIGLVPFKTLGLTNTSKNYTLFVTFTQEDVTVINERGEGDSFRYPFANYSFPEMIFAVNSQWANPDCSICEVYE